MECSLRMHATKYAPSQTNRWSPSKFTILYIVLLRSSDMVCIKIMKFGGSQSSAPRTPHPAYVTAKCNQVRMQKLTNERISFRVSNRRRT